MGRFVAHSDFRISEDLYPDIILALNDLGKTIYAYDDSGFSATHQKADYKSIEHAFVHYNWTLEADEGMTSIFPNDDCEYGDEVFFLTIAPYVTSGSVIEMANTEGFHWRYLFQNGTVQIQEGKVVYE